MRGLVLKEPGKFDLVESALEPIRDDEVRIKIDNVGICGSDIHLFKGDYEGPHRYPMYFGHEWAGTVCEVGSNVNGFKVGDKVTGDCSRWCGHCMYCQVDRNLCAHIEKFGISLDGASREFINVEARYLYKAPEDIDLKLLSLAEPLAVSINAVKKVAAEDISKWRILILGAGTIGLGVLLALRYIYSCNQVEMFDIDKERMGKAVTLGASAADLYQEEENGNRGSWSTIYSSSIYDLVVETTGNLKALKTALDKVKPRGKILCIGFPPPGEIAFKTIVMKALEIRGSIGGTGSFPEAIELINKKKNVVENLITHIFSIENVYEAFAKALDGSNAIKVQLKF